MVSTSSGTSDRKSMISASTPKRRGGGRGDEHHGAVGDDGQLRSRHAPYRPRPAARCNSPRPPGLSGCVLHGTAGLFGSPSKGPLYKPLRLEKHHRIVILDRGDQQALGIVRIRGHDDFEAADVSEYALGTLRMRLAAANAAAAGRADGHRRKEFAGAAIAQPRQFAHDLIEARIDVVGELNFRHRPQPVHAHADGRGHDAPLGDRRIEHPMLAVLALQSLGGAKHAAEIADVLAHQHHRRVACRA